MHWQHLINISRSGNEISVEKKEMRSFCVIDFSRTFDEVGLFHRSDVEAIAIRR